MKLCFIAYTDCKDKSFFDNTYHFATFFSFFFVLATLQQIRYDREVGHTLLYIGSLKPLLVLVAQQVVDSLHRIEG